MASTWLGQAGMVLDESAGDPPVDTEDPRRRRDVSHHRWPEWNDKVGAVMPVAPGANPGDRRDMAVRQQYEALMERRRLRAAQAAEAAEVPGDVQG